MPFVRKTRGSAASAQAAVCTTIGRRILLIGICVLLLRCFAHGQNPQAPSTYVPITMQQAVDLARARNPALLSAQQNLLSIKAQEIQAGVRANPYFGFTGSNITLPAEG